MPVLTAQPVKGFYALAAFAVESARFPFWALSYAFQSGRPNKRWTFRQALVIRILRAFLFHSARIQVNVPLSLDLGAEKDQFVIIEPSDGALYAGPMLLHPDVVKPEKIGATWYPRPPSNAELQDQDVVLHFHGGAYVIGDGRKADCGFAASTYIKHGNIPFVFCPQYRLSSSPSNCPFPGALQDALTSYLYLVRERGVPPNRIFVAGDSAGANLTLAFLRYIANFGPKLGIQPPAAGFLWSTWVDVYDSLDPARADLSPNASTDYVTGAFGNWGAVRYIPDSLKDVKTAPSEVVPYFNTLGHPFKTVPLFMAWGEKEMLIDDNITLAEEMRALGNNVETFTQPDAAHDIILIGKLLGFEQQARDSVVNAVTWARKVRNL